MTEATSECSGLEPAACVEGRGWGHAAGQGICCWRHLGSERGMGSPTMHAKTWKWRQTWQRASWYHRGGRYPGDSVMWQLQPIKCVWLMTAYTRVYTVTYVLFHTVSRTSLYCVAHNTFCVPNELFRRQSQIDGQSMHLATHTNVYVSTDSAKMYAQCNKCSVLVVTW